jgi:hypothetical protein
VLLWLQSDDLQLTVQQRPTHFDDVSEFLAIWQVSLSCKCVRSCTKSLRDKLLS